MPFRHSESQPWCRAPTRRWLLRLTADWTADAQVLAGKHMVPQGSVRVLGQPPFHATALTSSGQLSYIGGSWDRDIAFAGYSIPLQVRPYPCRCGRRKLPSVCSGNDQGQAQKRGTMATGPVFTLLLKHSPALGIRHPEAAHGDHLTGHHGTHWLLLPWHPVVAASFRVLRCSFGGPPDSE